MVSDVIVSDVGCRTHGYGGVYALRWWSDHLLCVVSCVVHGGVLCGWMIAYFPDLVSGEDGCMIESLSKFVVKVSVCCCFSCANENSTLCWSGERLLYVLYDGLMYLI